MTLWSNYLRFLRATINRIHISEYFVISEKRKNQIYLTLQLSFNLINLLLLCTKNWLSVKDFHKIKSNISTQKITALNVARRQFSTLFLNNFSRSMERRKKHGEHDRKFSPVESFRAIPARNTQETLGNQSRNAQGEAGNVQSFTIPSRVRRGVRLKQPGNWIRSSRGSPCFQEKQPQCFRGSIV